MPLYTEASKVIEMRNEAESQMKAIGQKIAFYEKKMELLDTLNRNTICLEKCVIEYLTEETARYKYYDEDKEAWSDWVEYPIHKDVGSGFSFPCDFSDAKIYCIPTSDYYQYKRMGTAVRDIDKYYYTHWYLYSEKAGRYVSDLKRGLYGDNQESKTKSISGYWYFLDVGYHSNGKNPYLFATWQPIESEYPSETIEGVFETMAFTMALQTVVDFHGEEESNIYFQRQKKIISCLEAGYIPSKYENIKIDTSLRKWEEYLPQQGKNAIASEISKLNKQYKKYQDQYDEYNKLMYMNKEEREAYTAKKKQSTQAKQAKSEKREKESNDSLADLLFTKKEQQEFTKEFKEFGNAFKDWKQMYNKKPSDYIRYNFQLVIKPYREAFNKIKNSINKLFT